MIEVDVEISGKLPIIDLTKAIDNLERETIKHIKDMVYPFRFTGALYRSISTLNKNITPEGNGNLTIGPKPGRGGQGRPLEVYVPVIEEGTGAILLGREAQERVRQWAEYRGLPPEAIIKTIRRKGIKGKPASQRLTEDDVEYVVNKTLRNLNPTMFIR